MAARIRRWIHTEWPFFVVVGLMLASVVYLMFFHGHWRRGAALIAAALLLATVFRAALPGPRVGMLAVRNRVLDSISLAVLGGVILFVAIRLH